MNPATMLANYTLIISISGETLGKNRFHFGSFAYSCPPSFAVSSLFRVERLDARLRPAKNQGMDIVGSLVSIYNLEVDHVAYHAEFVRDAIAAQHVTGHAGNIQGLAAGIALHDRGHFDGGCSFILHAPKTQAALKPEGNLGQHIGQLQLNELGGGQRPAELLTIEGVLAGDAVAFSPLPLFPVPERAKKKVRA